jgi:hypothetical protein
MSIIDRRGARQKRGTHDIDNRQKRKAAAELVIDDGFFSEEAIRGVIDEWIVPSVDERMISSISNPSQLNAMEATRRCAIYARYKFGPAEGKFD